MRKIMTVAMTVVLCLLTGCQKTESQDQEQVQKEKEIVLWVSFESQIQQNAVDELVSEFNDFQNTYELTWEYQGPLSQFKRKLADGAITGELPDLAILDNLNVQQYQERGLLEDITEYMEQEAESFYPETLESITYGDRYYGMPFSVYNQALFYNQTFFENAGILPPRNWNEFMDAAKVLTNEQRYGFAMPALTADDVAIQLLPWALSWGGENKLTLKGMEGAYEMLATLMENKVLSKECINWSANDVYRKFVNGECAMMVNKPGVIQELDQEQIQYAVVPFPSIRTQVEVALGDALVLMRDGNKEGGLAFMDFFHQDDIMGDSRQLAFGMPPRDTLVQRFLGEKEIYVSFTRAIIYKYEFQITDIGNWKNFSDTVSDEAVNIMIERATPQEAALKMESYLPPQ